MWHLQKSPKGSKRILKSYEIIINHQNRPVSAKVSQKPSAKDGTNGLAGPMFRRIAPGASKEKAKLRSYRSKGFQHWSEKTAGQLDCLIDVWGPLSSMDTIIEHMEMLYISIYDHILYIYHVILYAIYCRWYGRSRRFGSVTMLLRLQPGLPSGVPEGRARSAEASDSRAASERTGASAILELAVHECGHLQQRQGGRASEWVDPKGLSGLPG